MKVKFTEGPDDVIDLAPIRAQVKRGEAVEVPDEIGKQLVAQGWEKVAASAKPKKDEE